MYILPLTVFSSSVMRLAIIISERPQKLCLLVVLRSADDNSGWIEIVLENFALAKKLGRKDDVMLLKLFVFLYILSAHFFDGKIFCI